MLKKQIKQKSPKNMPSIVKCSVKNNHNNSPDTLYGTMPLNYFQELHPPCQDASYPSIKKKFKKFITSSRNT